MPSKRRMKKALGREWTPADTALWNTLAILDDIEHRRVPTQRVDTYFVPVSGELAFASGPFAMDSLRSAGDGTYVHNSSFAFGTGLVGMTVAAGIMAGSAAGNAQRRAQAAADAQVVWRPDFGGTITVTNLGFCLQTGTGVFRWDWASISLTEVAGFTDLILQGHSENGPVTWRMHSDWAELVFVLWAMARHPDHPQFRSGAWIPANWVEWASSRGYAPRIPLSLTADR